MKDEIERLGFGVIADEDKHPYCYTHSDRFLIIDLKNRKEIIHREYRPNPDGKICKEKYYRPSNYLDESTKEEYEIYKRMAEIVKDCKYVTGKNFGGLPVMALQEAGSDYMMMDMEPQEWIDSHIEARELAGFRD